MNVNIRQSSPERFLTKTPCSISPLLFFPTLHHVSRSSRTPPAVHENPTGSQLPIFKPVTVLLKKRNFEVFRFILLIPFIHNWFPKHQLKSQALRTLGYLCSVHCLAKWLVVAQNCLFQAPKCGKSESYSFWKGFLEQQPTSIFFMVLLFFSFGCRKCVIV